MPARMVPAPDPQQMVTIEPPVEADGVVLRGRSLHVHPGPVVAWRGHDLHRDGRGRGDHRGPACRQRAPGHWPDAGLPRLVRARPAATGSHGTRRSAPTRCRAWRCRGWPSRMPPMLTSVNQIGFDFYDWIGGAVRTNADSTVVWFVGAKPGAGGQVVADPSARFAFPVLGPQRGGNVRVDGCPGQPLVHVRPGPTAPVRPARDVRCRGPGRARLAVPRRGSVRRHPRLRRPDADHGHVRHRPG